MIGQCSANQFGCLVRIGFADRGTLCLGDLQFFEPRLQMFKLMIQLLRTVPELHMLEFRDDGLLMLDFSGMAINGCALHELQRLARVNVLRQRIGLGRHG